jgi:hypothetical protein
MTCHSRLFAIFAGAMLASGCHGGVANPVAPSALATSIPVAPDSATVVPSDEVATAQEAPVSYSISELSGSGYSGTCTVSSSHTGGLRVKADGQGIANSLVELNIVDVTSAEKFRTTAYVEVNERGTFRTGWDAIGPTYFPTGHSLQCWLTNSTDTTQVLASTDPVNFPAP